MVVGQLKSGDGSRAMEIGQWKSDNVSCMYVIELLEDVFG